MFILLRSLLPSLQLPDTKAKAGASEECGAREEREESRDGTYPTPPAWAKGASAGIRYMGGVASENSEKKERALDGTGECGAGRAGCN
jgi:hypothetical protein